VLMPMPVKPGTFSYCAFDLRGFQNLLGEVDSLKGRGMENGSRKKNGKSPLFSSSGLRPLLILARESFEGNINEKE